MSAYTETQLQVLRHMLGVDDPYGPQKPYRDYFCSNPGDSKLRDLASLGLVEMYSQHGNYEWFRCTPAGREAALRSAKARRPSKAKLRYAHYLNVKDALGDLSFIEFLRMPPSEGQ